MAERGQPEHRSGNGQTAQSAGSENYLRAPDDLRAAEDSSTAERSKSSDTRRTANRGFAAMSPEKQKRIASEGGRAAHRQGVAHEWNRDEAREAGRKGGHIVSQNRDHMSEIGRKGGQNSGQRRQRPNEESL